MSGQMEGKTRKQPGKQGMSERTGGGRWGKKHSSCLAAVTLEWRVGGSVEFTSYVLSCANR